MSLYRIRVTLLLCALHFRACDAKITLLEAGRVLDKVWLLIDMDSFYARWVTHGGRGPGLAVDVGWRGYPVLIDKAALICAHR